MCLQIVLFEASKNCLGSFATHCFCKEFWFGESFGFSSWFFCDAGSCHLANRVDPATKQVAICVTAGRSLEREIHFADGSEFELFARAGTDARQRELGAISPWLAALVIGEHRHRNGR